MKDTIFYLTAWRQDFSTPDSSGFYDQSDTDMCAFAEWYHQKREQERQGPAPDRDELAMTMPVDHLPQIKGINMFENIGEEIVSKQVDDILADIKSSLECDARVRYMYADAMLKARKV